MAEEHCNHDWELDEDLKGNPICYCNKCKNFADEVFTLTEVSKLEKELDDAKERK